ncbi:hypothetical protein [Tardiphaga sp.]|uniref:hypothetical protein n=1 Tax=Tardiphaga sp. TaxID=1926292 RepID=UPI0026387E27|nr:hypothetical protein [Tardiphaga sp.]MDB5616220.1 hypothetical protein [Tardiphaga sp.]
MHSREVDGRDAETVLVAKAIAAFERAGVGDDIIVSLVEALSCIVRIADSEEAFCVSRAEASRLVEIISDLAPRLVEQVGTKVSNDRYFLGMAGAFGIASLFGRSRAGAAASVTPDLLHDQFDHVLLLMAELQAILCICRIAGRGGLLRDIMADRTISNITKH